MLNLVAALAAALEEKGVVYAHFKSNEHLWQSVAGDTDFDILVDRRSASAFEEVLRSLKFKRFCSPVRASYPGVDDWIGMDPETAKFIHLHTHYQLVTGKSGYKNYVLPWTAQALSDRIRDEETGIYVVSPAFELVELYTRIVAKMAAGKDRKARSGGYTLSGGTLAEAKWLWQRTDDAQCGAMAAQCFCDAEVPETALFFKEHLSAQEYGALRRCVLQKLTPHTRAGMGCVNLRSFISKYQIKVWRKLRKMVFVPGHQQKKFCHDGGLLIAFLGVDGSGKTTVTNEIHSWLSWKMESSLMSLGFGRRKQGLMYKTKQKIKKMLGRPDKKTSHGPTEDKPVEKTFKALRKQRTMVRFAKSVRRDILKIHSYCLNGGIMIVDRYPQLEYFGIADGPKVNSAYPELRQKEREYLSIVNEIKPDIVFKLMVPVEVSQQRRPEDSPLSLQRKFEILTSLEYPDSLVVEVDATQPLEQELLFIKRIIWENL